MTNRFTTNTKRSPDRTTVVILAAAAGRRMIGYGLRNLLPYQNKLVLDYQINSARTIYPNSEIIIVGGFQHEILYDYVKDMSGVTLLYNPQYKTSLNTLSLYMALLTIKNSNVLFMNGDIICSPSGMPSANTNQFTVDTRGKIHTNEVGVGIENGLIVNLAFGLEAKWGQMGFVCLDSLDDMRECCSQVEKPLFICLSNFCNRRQVTGYENNKSVLIEIDSIKDLP